MWEIWGVVGAPEIAPNSVIFMVSMILQLRNLKFIRDGLMSLEHGYRPMEFPDSEWILPDMLMTISSKIGLH